MKKNKMPWTVVREYNNYCSVNEILRVIIRRHLEQENPDKHRTEE